MESVILRKLKIVQDAKGDIAEVERQLDEGQIEEAIDIAKETALPSIRILDSWCGLTQTALTWLMEHVHGQWIKCQPFQPDQYRCVVVLPVVYTDSLQSQ